MPVDLRPRFKTAATAGAPIRLEIGNALARLQADRPKLANACEPAQIGRLVTMILEALDRECRWHFGLWTLADRRRHLRVWSVLRPDGIDVGMCSTAPCMGGYQREPGGREGDGMPNWVALKTKRKEELLQIPAIMALVERAVLHAYQLLREQHALPHRLLITGRRIPGVGYARITFEI